MAYPTFTPPRAPSPGTVSRPKLKILKTEFGDGYTQRTADGINHMKRGAVLTWEDLLPEQASAIIAFLEARKGYEPFYYQPVNQPRTLWTCEEWDDQVQTDGFRKVSATLEQCFSTAV